MSGLEEFLSANWMVLLAAAALAVLVLRGPLSRKLSGIEEIAPEKAVQLINQHDALVIDVREHQEWSGGHLPGARHIPLGDLQKYLKDLENHRERHVICQCASGMRSAKAAGALHKAGFERVYSLRGGIQAWKDAGLPVEK